MILCTSLSKDNLHHDTKVKSVLSKYWNYREANPQFWDNLQETYKCCGIMDSSEWDCIPKSCYRTQTTWMIFKRTTYCDYPHETGCFCVILKYLNEMTAWFKMIALSFVTLGIVAIVGILLIGFTCLVFRKTNIF